MAIKLALKARRQSTVTCYNNKWATWVSFCGDQPRKIDPLHPKPCHMANFLTFLYCERDLSYASLLGYRSAIVNTIRSARCCDTAHLCSDPLVLQVLDGVKQEFPKKQVSPPLWDVFLVLRFLRGSSFEPIARTTIKKLTQKTLFLVMLACSRRISGIHALSGLDKDIEFAKHDSACFLTFLPEFRAKNQNPLSDAQSVEIKSLSTILNHDDEDRLNCPVRIIQAYLAKTHSYRLGKRRFFLSLNKTRRDISKNSLSIWLRDLIRDAYRDALLEPPIGASHTHEIRKVSTSIAWSKNASLESIMRAAFWRSESTFTDYYLRDVRVNRRNDTYGINALAVAGSTITL